MGKSKTRIIIMLLVMLVFSGAKGVAQNQCDFLISKHTDIIDGALLGVEPGDVVCLEAGVHEYLLFKNIEGTPDNPVLITNVDGQVIINTNHNFGISIRQSHNVILSGKGDANFEYGFDIQRVDNGSGVGISNFSTDVEIEGLEISNTAFAGIVSKTDPTCNENGVPYPTRNDFTQRNIIIHDNYIHDTGGEGMYIGSSFFRGYEITCDGEEYTVLPHVNEHVDIYNNKVERTGWDGIQVSSAIFDCQIHDNLVLYDSQEGYEGQMSGFLIGGGSQCDCYNNQIFDGKGDGIEMLGMGDQKVYNNLIVRPGKSYLPADMTKPKYGIFCSHIYTEPNAFLYFYNNTIISPKADGINFRNDHLDDVRAYNNIILHTGTFDDLGADSYIHKDNVSTYIDQHHNHFSQDIYAVLFDSPANDDYDLQSASPAIDAGVSLSEISFDILNRSRPFASGWDLGAFECHKPGAAIDEVDKYLISKKLYPIPVTNKLYVDFGFDRFVTAQLTIRNSLGQKVYSDHHRLKQKEHRWTIVTYNWKSGVYILSLQFNKGTVTERIIKQ
jgi:hypothetical protein